MAFLSADGKPIKVGGKFLKVIAGAVSSVNGKTGAVELTAKDVGAISDTEFDVLNKSSSITTTWGDNVTWQIKDFWRWGAVCVFTLQFICNTAIESTYGFIFATLPYRAVSRVWINNSNAFYIDGGGNTVRRNSSSISTGAYILTGFYLTNDPK